MMVSALFVACIIIFSYMENFKLCFIGTEAYEMNSQYTSWLIIEIGEDIIMAMVMQPGLLRLYTR